MNIENNVAVDGGWDVQAINAFICNLKKEADYFKVLEKDELHIVKKNFGNQKTKDKHKEKVDKAENMA